jgi:hypothetical protein
MARSIPKSKPIIKAEKTTVASSINKTEPQQTSAPGKQVWIWIGIALACTLIAYLPAFHAGFVNWDDDDYVVKNFLIRDLSNLKALITTPVQGNYHPLTMISLAINYAISELDPSSYHLFNIVLHLLNVLLVFRLVFQLSKENTLIAFTCALLFGVHPMHVESVAWVSERKDVVFTFFFLLGLMSYLKYSDANSNNEKSGASSRYYVLSLLFLVLSLSAKPAAVVFPVLLLCFDFLRGRKFALKLIIEKIPYFILALVFGLLTMQAQKTIGATGIEGFYSFGSRMFFGFYGYMMYFVKLIAPFDLAAFIPYPAVNQSLPIAYLISPLFFLLTLVLCIRTWKKYREITFAFAFYLVNLILVLQFIPVGSAIIADRYTYVPYIGILY